MPNSFLARSILFMHGCFDDFSMGECFENGKYVDMDVDAAILCYRNAAKSGKVIAYIKLANIFLKRNNLQEALYNFWLGQCLVTRRERLL